MKIIGGTAVSTSIPGRGRRGTLGRRRLLLDTGGLLAGAAAVVAVSGCSAVVTAAAVDGTGLTLPGGKDPLEFVVYGADPYEVETQREKLDGELVTPAGVMFLRQNLPLPDPGIVADPDSWELTVEGVSRPRTLTVSELRKLGRSEVAAVIQCSGNGRGFFGHGPKGSPWRVGAVANARWAGVLVRTLVEELGGPVPEARLLTATGAEPLPQGVDPLEKVVERSVPIAKGLADCLLAWKMNGAPIPLAHGGPLRLIVPGYWGVNQVKFVGRLAFTAEETEAAIQRTGYRVRPVGVRGDPSQPSMWEMNVKSMITHPTDQSAIDAGPVEVRGFAWAGEADVAGVEVSTDGGATWADAQLDPADGPAGWRGFRRTVILAAGEYRLVSRATDVAGEQQPAEAVANERGYGHNGWRNPALTVEVD